MTREETIVALDNLIAYINRCVGQRSSEIEYNVLSTLKKLPISAPTISAITNIHIDDDSFNQIIHTSSIEGVMRQNDKKYIGVVVKILQSERAMQVQAMQDEAQKENLAQQKRSNRIQIWTLICSIVAALAALYPIIESLIKKLLN